MISTTRAQARRRSILLALSGWVALAATWLPAGSVVRPLVVAAFLASCPGAAMLGWWPDTDRLERAVLAVALSISAALAVTATLAGDAAEVEPVTVPTDSHPLPSITLAAAWNATGVNTVRNDIEVV